MASPLTHAIVGATIAAVHGLSLRVATPWWLAILCAVAPDVDAIGYWLGVPYESFWGHRGFTHSIAFAVMIGWICARWSSSVMSRLLLWSVYFMAALSHGLLDALTDGGLGVAFFSPVDQSRYFFPSALSTSRQCPCAICWALTGLVFLSTKCGGSGCPAE